MQRSSILTAVLLAALLAGCAGQRIEPAAAPPREDLGNAQWVRQTLYAQFEEWKAVKYRAGGLSKTGVDCSGFVFLTFDSRLGIKLPRSTDEQVNAGTPIAVADLLPGDLVFFRTGRNTRHVGIYLENRKFLHASTERGVMISSLDDRYWARTYWKSVRVDT